MVGLRGGGRRLGGLREGFTGQRREGKREAVGCSRGRRCERRNAREGAGRLSYAQRTNSNA
eukprot:2296638-Pleurochrysis_carterae.AAC.2